jgi:hypothetical protein
MFRTKFAVKTKTGNLYLFFFKSCLYETIYENVALPDKPQMALLLWPGNTTKSEIYDFLF